MFEEVFNIDDKCKRFKKLIHLSPQDLKQNLGEIQPGQTKSQQDILIDETQKYTKGNIILVKTNFDIIIGGYITKPW